MQRSTQACTIRGTWNAPKVATRNTYIQHIIELIKNRKKKQDVDIACIIHGTQQFQRESNAAQYRLHCTYAIVDEFFFRDAKNEILYVNKYTCF